jgi:hypothetical protein
MKQESDVYISLHSNLYISIVANIAVVKQEKAEKLEMILIQVTSIEIYN